MSSFTEPGQNAPDAAFVLALTESQTALRAYCEASLGNREEGKDAWQRTNVVLWRKAGEWDQKKRFLPWALAVARYEVLAVIRDRQRDLLVFDEDVALAMVDESLHVAETVGARRDALALCTEKLQPRHRDVLSAHYVLGHPHAEIAASHRMRLSAVKVLLMRLRRSLADCIERRLNEQTA